LQAKTALVYCLEYQKWRINESSFTLRPQGILLTYCLTQNFECKCICVMRLRTFVALLTNFTLIARLFSDDEICCNVLQR